MHNHPLLLCLSRNPELLAIRQRVLATRYSVVSVETLDEMEAQSADRAFDLLVICHTLSDGDCHRAIHLARQRWPEIKILSITASTQGKDECEVDAAISALAGPLSLFAGIRQLLEQQKH